MFSVLSELQKLESEAQILGFCGSKNHKDFSESAQLSNSTPFFSKDRFFLQRPAWRWAYFSAAKKTHAFLKLLAALERDTLFCEFLAAFQQPSSGLVSNQRWKIKSMSARKKAYRSRVTHILKMPAAFLALPEWASAEQGIAEKNQSFEKKSVSFESDTLFENSLCFLWPT